MKKTSDATPPSVRMSALATDSPRPLSDHAKTRKRPGKSSASTVFGVFEVCVCVVCVIVAVRGTSAALEQRQARAV
jgi:hypothetical protein